VYIRSVRLTDIVRHGRLSRQLLRLNQPDASIIGRSPFDVSVRSWLPMSGSLRTFVLGDERPRGLIQVAARDRGHIWVVLALGSEETRLAPEGWEDPTHPWVLLLNSMAVLAVRRRVTRLLAKTPETAPELACFRQAGYQVYGREFIYARPYAAADRLAEAGNEPRPQRGGDAWAIHRLYFQTAPRAVQDAEAHTSNRWELRQARRGAREHGWLLEDGAETLAYTRTLSRRGAHLVEWLFNPAHRDLLPRLGRQTLARLPASPGDQVFVRLPEYQAEAEATLVEAGFTRVATQALLVKYLAVKAAAREPSFALRARAKASRAPSVQSYLRRAGDQ
jgi:hypothetical protein